MHVKHFPDISSVKRACERAIAHACANDSRISTLSSTQLSELLAAAGFSELTATDLRMASKRHQELSTRERRKGDQVSSAFVLEVIAAACGYQSWNILRAVLGTAGLAVAKSPAKWEEPPAGPAARASDRFARSTMYAVIDREVDGPARRWRLRLWEEVSQSPGDLPRILRRLAGDEGAVSYPNSSVQVVNPRWLYEWAHAAADLCRGLIPAVERGPTSNEGAALLVETLADLTKPDTYIKHLATFLADEQGEIDLRKATPALHQFSVTQLIIARAASFNTTRVERLSSTATAMQLNLAREFLALQALRKSLFDQAGVVKLVGS